MSTSARIRQASRRATSPFRTLPDVLVIGGMRCGTSSLYGWLAIHDEVTVPVKKEIHFFNHHWDRGVSWYKAFFPMGGDDVFTFDATPAYMSHPDAAARAHQVVPDAKIVASLRDPVERAWSHYRFRTGLGYEHRGFSEAIHEDLAAAADNAASGFSNERIASYLPAGRYGDQLPTWFATYGKEQIHLIDADALFAGDTQALADLEDFLGLSRTELPLWTANASAPAEISPEDKALLVDYYADSNERLAALTDQPFRWLER